MFFLRLTEFVVVYDMVGVGILCRDTTSGRSFSPVLVTFTNDLQVFLILNLNGVHFFSMLVCGVVGGG
jgi:hypothetical protein